ncbi:uncharacterized protein LOC144162970 [Haemaphysalis longicornis]
MDSQAQRILLSLIQRQPPSATEDAVLHTSRAVNVQRQADDGTCVEAGPSCIRVGGGKLFVHLPGGTASNLASISPVPGDGQACAPAGPSGTKRGGGAAEWTEGQTKLLLEYYFKYFPQIGPFKKFKNRKQAFQQISRDVEAVLGIKKTPQQCENRYKTVIRRRKAASDNNNQSGASPCPVPFDDDIRKIESIDDSIEPEVQRDASGAVFKNSPESPSLVSPNAKTTDKTESQSESADVKPRAGTARLQHMQLFFSEVRAIHEQKESLRAARHLKKENRRAERQADRQALREERRKMHDEKMGILRQAFGLQK